MLESSASQIYLMPETSDVVAKRLADCAARLTSTERQDFDDQGKLGMVCKVVLGQDHFPDAVDLTLFDHNIRKVHSSKVKPWIKVLNRAQYAATQYISHSPRLFKLVQGPPGTGKSTLLASLMGLCKAFNHSTLFCAPSNTAVDELLKKIQLLDDRMNSHGEKINVIRYYNQKVEGDMILRLDNQFHQIKTSLSPMEGSELLKSHGLC